MSQLHAAYLFDSVKEQFEEKHFQDYILPLIKHLSCFEADSKNSLKAKNVHAQTAVLHNIVTAGRPAKASVYIEELFSVFLKRTERDNIDPKIKFSFAEADLQKELEAAFYFIDSRAEIKRSTAKDDKQAFNQQVIRELTEKRTHKAISHFFVKNKDAFKRIIPDDQLHTLSRDEAEIAEIIPDFIIDLPSEYRGIKGMIIETDPETGAAGLDYLGIEKKRTLAEKFKYKYLYVKNGQIQESLPDFESFTFNEYFDKIKKNYDLPLFGKTSGKNALQYALGPIAVARIQKVVCEAIFAEQLNPEAKRWKIGVIERDVPAAYAAFEDLKKQYNYICNIQGVSKQFPDVELDIYTTPEFSDSKMHKACKHQTVQVDEFDSKKDYDLLIDLAVLQTKETATNIPRTASANTVKIRSCRYVNSRHRFYFGKNLNLFDTEGAIEKSREEAITAILQNIFRIPSVSPQDMNRIFSTLCAEDTILLQSPGETQYISEIFFSLFRAGITLMICPNNISLTERFDKIRSLDIDACFYLNSIRHRIKDKKKAAQRVIDHESLILLTTAEYIRTPFFGKTVEDMKANGINFSGLFIEGITALSEYSSDFNPMYKGIADYSRQLLKVKGFGLPVFALGHHADYAIIEDIKADTGINSLISRPVDVQKFDVNIIETKTTGISDSDIILRKAFENKQEALSELITEIPEDDKILILYPFRSSKGGQYSQNLTESTAQYDETVGGRTYGVFNESSMFERERFNTEDYLESKKSFDGFVNGSIKILAATEQIIYTSKIPELKRIILFNMAESPESLYQIAGLFGGKSRENTLYILQDNSDLVSKELSDAATADGKQESMEQFAGTDPDTFVRGQSVKLRFPGRKSDLYVSRELLQSIEIPETEPRRELENAIAHEFEIQTELYAAPEDSPKRIYAGKDNKIIGYYDFDNEIFNTDNSAYSEQYALRILHFIKERAEKYEGGSNEFLKNFTHKRASYQIGGIEKYFENNKNGERQRISFYLYNNTIKQTAELAKRYADYSFDEETLRFVFETSKSEKEFIRSLNQKADLNHVDQDIDLPSELKKLFAAYRDAAKTLVSLGRFTDMGLIDAYDTDLNNGRVSIEFAKRSDTYYKERLKVILTKYLAAEKADEILNDLDNYSGDNMISKVLNFLINFTYDEIREARINQIESMTDWVKTLSQIETPEIRQAEIKNFFHAVFVAKYLNSTDPNSLISETDNFDGGSFQTVMAFIYKAEYLKNNIEHLYLSSDKAQKVHDDNYIVLLLNAFARFRKFGNSDDFDTAFRRLYLGFEAMEAYEAITYEESLRRRELFLEILYKYNSDLQSQIDPLIYLKTHTQKLVDFNAKFLKGMNSVS